jgi:hypothetical protein
METYIRIIHEEVIPDSENELGVLLNEPVSTESDFKDQSFVYIYRKNLTVRNMGTYIFFNSLIEMIDFYLYGNDKCVRAYMREDVFDVFYDDSFDGKFNDHLEWVK